MLRAVPKVFWNETVYLVNEDNEAVQVVVSTNEEHLTPVVFQLVFTNTSAIGMCVRLYWVVILVVYSTIHHLCV